MAEDELTRLSNKILEIKVIKTGRQKPIVFISEDPNILEQLSTLSKNFNPETIQVKIT